MKDNTIGVLPIYIFFFTASLTNQTTQFLWHTSPEINTSYFNVEYSNNGKEFALISSIKAKGSTGKKEYAINFKVANQPDHYYRIKMIYLIYYKFLNR